VLEILVRLVFGGVRFAGYGVRVQQVKAGEQFFNQAMGNNGRIEFLYNKNFDDTSSKITLYEGKVRDNNLGTILSIHPNRGFKRKETWYYRPGKFFYPEGDKFEKMKFKGLLAGQGSSGKLANQKTIVMGPILPDAAGNEHFFQEWKYEIWAYFYFILGGKRWNADRNCSLQNEHHQIPAAPKAPTHNELRTRRPMW
jgi:hypothetical protein